MREQFTKYFIGIEDTRCQCDISHNLQDVLILVMCAVLCGLDELSDIVEYGKEKSNFLEKHFDVKSTPSESTLSRIMNMVSGEKIAECVVKIMQNLIGIEGEIIAADGKTVCSTAKKGSWREKLHILTAYMTSNGVTLGQLSVGEKTNEIPILRELLDMIDIKGKIITADAMHTQKETVEKIIDNGGDYVLGLKGNQGAAFHEIKSYIDDSINDKGIEVEFEQTIEKKQGSH